MSIKIQKSQTPTFLLYMFIVAAVLVVGSILIPKACDNAKPEYAYSPNLAVGEKAFVDIDFLVPEYTIAKYEKSPTSALLCRCKTTIV